jgi:hypothetical protein
MNEWIANKIECNPIPVDATACSIAKKGTDHDDYGGAIIRRASTITVLYLTTG